MSSIVGHLIGTSHDQIRRTGMTMVTKPMSTVQKSLVASIHILNFVSTTPNPLVVLTPELIPTHPERN